MNPIGKPPVPMEPISPVNVSQGRPTVNEAPKPLGAHFNLMTTASAANQATGTVPVGFSSSNAASLQGSRFDPNVAAFGNSFSGWYGYVNSMFSMILSSSGNIKAVTGRKQIEDDAVSNNNADPDSPFYISTVGEAAKSASVDTPKTPASFALPTANNSEGIQQSSAVWGNLLLGDQSGGTPTGSRNFSKR
ncbi:MAG: hypothetical protein VKJ04_09090 [Vampirovibrionales bacterium]|nr:hypothetical protein [Vampirovibrionales bacterium]